MTDTTSPSSRDIEREANESRAQLSNTLDQLRERLSPGQILDDVLTGSGANVSGFAQNLGTSIKDNPIPSVLIGAGLMMLMTGTTGLSSRRRVRSYGAQDIDPAIDRAMDRAADGDMGHGGEQGTLRDAASSAGSAAASGMRSVRDAASGLASSASSAASGAASTMSDMADTARARAHDVRDSVTGAVSGVASGVSGMASGMASGVSSMADGATGLARTGADRMQGMVSTVAEQPLVLGALGLAVGAALGALLPSTDVENRVMGESASKVKDRAKALASEELEQARHVAEATMHEVQQAASEQGLSMDTATSGARNLGDKLAAVADRATETLKSEAQKAVDKMTPDDAREPQGQRTPPPDTVRPGAPGR